jgi:DNA polymerase III epsilon subunit-like protein
LKQKALTRQTTKHIFQQQQQQQQQQQPLSTTAQKETIMIESPYILLSEPLRSGRIIVFDLETTGFSSQTDSIIEIGAVEVIDCVRTGLLFQSYAQPRTRTS